MNPFHLELLFPGPFITTEETKTPCTTRIICLCFLDIVVTEYHRKSISNGDVFVCRNWKKIYADFKCSLIQRFIDYWSFAFLYFSFSCILCWIRLFLSCYKMIASVNNLSFLMLRYSYRGKKGCFFFLLFDKNRCKRWHCDDWLRFHGWKSRFL